MAREHERCHSMSCQFRQASCFWHVPEISPTPARREGTCLFAHPLILIPDRLCRNLEDGQPQNAYRKKKPKQKPTFFVQSEIRPKPLQNSKTKVDHLVWKKIARNSSPQLVLHEASRRDRQTTYLLVTDGE